MTRHPALNSLLPWLRLSPWFFALAALFWFGSLSTFNLGIDQEAALFRSDERVWIDQGRWAIFFLTQYLYPQPVLSYVPHLLFIGLLTLSYVLLLDAFTIEPEKNQNKRWALLTAGLFLAHPIWYFIAEFYTNIVPAGLGMLSCSVALWLYAKKAISKPVLNASAQILLLFFALGNYQAFVLVMACMYVALLSQHYLNQRINTKQLWQQGGLALLYLLLAVALHQLFLQLLYLIYTSSPDYVNKLLDIQQTQANPLAVLKSVLEGGVALYAGFSWLYGSSLIFMGFAFFGGLALWVFNALKKPRRPLLLLLLLLLGITPLLLHVAAAGFWHMPLRAGLAMPFVVWFVVATALIRLQSRGLKALFVLLILAANVQLLHTHAKYSSAKQLTLSYDQHMAHQLFNDITTLIPDYDVEQSYPLSVHGGLRYHSPYGAMPPTTAITGSIFWWDGGNKERISRFLRAQGLRGLVPASAEQEQKLQPLYDSMPVWPAQGAIRQEEGVIMIKLGDTP